MEYALSVRRLIAIPISLLLAGAVVGCGRTIGDLDDEWTGTPLVDAAEPNDTFEPSDMSAPGSPSDTMPPDGGGHTGYCGKTQCTNCSDDDGDGLIDLLDPDCTGPLDNDEGSLATGVPGSDDPCIQHCSPGDCDFDVRCATWSKNPRCPYVGDEALRDPTVCSEETRTCAFACTLRALACDAFGCCPMFVKGARYFIKLVPGCDDQSLLDPLKCPPCTPDSVAPTAPTGF